MRSRLTHVAYVCSAIVFALIVLSPISLRAQEARGTISGTVMDSNKAAVPGASVTITNVAMGTSHKATTNDSGLYTVPILYREPTASSLKGPDSKNTFERASPFKSTTSSRLMLFSRLEATRKL